MYICITQFNLLRTTLHCHLMLYVYINISKGGVLYKTSIYIFTLITLTN